MGLEKITSQNQCVIGLEQNIQINKNPRRIYFGNNQVNDSFQVVSPLKLFNETEIKSLIEKNQELKKFLSENKLSIRLNMNELLNLKENHCKETVDTAVLIANNLPQALKQQVNYKDLKDAALLHDFGKVLIPLEILNKSGSLNDKEHKIMDLHSEIGYLILKKANVNNNVLNLIRYHHDNVEKPKSYIPDINLQVLNLADKYSALTEKRVYKEKFPPPKALTILYSDVKDGKVHPFVFNALVKGLQGDKAMLNIKNC